MNIDTSNTHPVYAYSIHGKHRVPFEVVQWLQAELQDAERIQDEYNKRGEETQYDNYDEEIERHEQDGYVWAIKRVLQYVTGAVNE